MQSPAKFPQGVLALLKHTMVSVGSSRSTAVQWGSLLKVRPHVALQGPLRQIIDTRNKRFAKVAPYTSILVRNKDAIDTSLNAVGFLWAAGYDVDIDAIDQNARDDESPKMICDLPAYP